MTGRAMSGNSRTLVERALIIARGDTITPEDLPLQPRPDQAVAAPPLMLAEIEKTTILSALERNRGDRRETARQLGISLRTLQYRLKEYGLIG